MFFKIAKSFFGRYIIKTVRAIEKLSTSFENSIQDLSFGGCNFSVSCLVPEILAYMKLQRRHHFGANKRFVSDNLFRAIHHKWNDNNFRICYLGA